MSFRLVPKLVTLNDLERRKGLFCLISPSQRYLDYILSVSTTQSRDTMSHFNTIFSTEKLRRQYLKNQS